MNEHLMQAVLDAAWFFEMSTDEECDPDLAVKQLELIAYRLRQMAAAEQRDFREFTYRSAEAHPNPDLGAHLRHLVDGLLLDDEQ